MKKTLVLLGLAIALLAGVASVRLAANNGNPQGGTVISHKGRVITVDEAGCIDHMTDHSEDYVISGPCGAYLPD